MFDDAVAASFGVTRAQYLGHGGEAVVFALDDARVLRVLHGGGLVDDLRRRQDLIDELARSRPPFELPETLEIGERAGRSYAIERRLAGRSLLEELGRADGAARDRLVEAHLDAAAALGDLLRRDTFGDLLVGDAVVTLSWREYLERRAAANLARSLPDFGGVDPRALADALPDAPAPAFVHLDAFTGNMLTDGRRITAVLDFGPTSITGDCRFNPLGAAVYLASPEITPVATVRDHDVATSWLRNAGLHDSFEPARRWLAAYWTFAFDDPNVLRWCRSVLLN